MDSIACSLRLMRFHQFLIISAHSGHTTVIGSQNNSLLCISRWCLSHTGTRQVRHFAVTFPPQK